MGTDNRKRVLVVDDDGEIRRLLSSTFRHYGLNVDVASGGEEALTLIGTNPYAVVVLDLVMPDVDGFAVLTRLRTMRMAYAPVIIVLTGAEDRIVGSLDANIVHGIIRKPFDPQELGSIVVACAEMRSRTPFETMALAAMLAGPPIVAWLTKL